MTYLFTPPAPVAVPDLVGLAADDAAAALADAGLTGDATEAYDATVPEGTVVSQDPAPDTELAAGYELTVVAACVIGGVSIGGGVGSVLGAALGVLFIGVVNGALPVIQVSPFWQQAIAGAVILVSVLLNSRAHRQPGQQILERRVP